MEQYVSLIQILGGTVRLAVPVLLACLAGLYSERAGIVDIGLEGKLLASAFAAAVAASVFGYAWIGIVFAILTALAFSGIHGLASINFRGNQTISGVALNFLAAGLTVFLGNAWFHRGGFTPQLNGAQQRFLPITLETLNTPLEWVTLPAWAPWIDWLRPAAQLFLYVIELPFYWFGRLVALILGWVASNPIGDPLVNQLILGHNIITYFAFLVVPITAWVLFRTRFGLRLRAVGENPKAIDTAGISVTRLRYQALVITAVLVGIGGAYLSIAQNAVFTPNMSNGRGYVALAALIFAKWRPGPALLVCLMFGFLDAVQIRTQGATLEGVWNGLNFVFGAWLPLIPNALLGLKTYEIPVQAVQVLPYVLTVILLAGFIGRAIAPKASGLPYIKDR
ncbi:MAG: ABC transporter permease [Devosia sp.]